MTPLTDALQHRGMLSTAGLFDIIFVSADNFLFYVVLSVCSQYSVHQALLWSRFEIKKAWCYHVALNLILWCHIFLCVPMKNQSENIKLSNVKKKNNNFPSYMYLPTHLLIVWVGNAKRWPYEFFFLICNKKRYFVLAWHGIKCCITYI